MLFIPPPPVPVIDDAPPPPPPLGLSYLDGKGPSASATTHNFTGVAIGNEDAQIIACVLGWNYVGALDLASATIGGVEAEIERQGDGTNCGLALFWAQTGAESPVTIQAVFPANTFNVTLAVYRIVGQSADAPVIASIDPGGGTAVRGIVVDAPANCAMIAGAVNTGIGPADGTFTGVGEDAELGSPASFRSWSGSRITTDAEEALTISHSACRQIVMAGWG